MTIEIGRVRGVANHYGVRDTSNKYGGQESTKEGVVKSAEWAFAWNDLSSVLASNLAQSIPANASIVEATLYVDEAWVGGTNLTVGLYTSAGVAIDADGLVAATVTATLTANKVVVGAGALVGTTVGATAGQLVAATTGTYTAGTARVVVKYKYSK
tara:strand:- start:43 stop:510 length:468 start_codon:yes stop_codon:yes gene_type:complete